jgi:hypothetical protein
MKMYQVIVDDELLLLTQDEEAVKVVVTAAIEEGRDIEVKMLTTNESIMETLCQPKPFS